MIESRLVAKIGFYNQLIVRIKNRHIITDPCRNIGFRDIDVDDNEIIKIQNDLYDLTESLAEMIANGYEDINNLQDDIQYMLTDIQEYTGIITR